MKELYVPPKIVVMSFSTTDIITASDWVTEDELPDDYE